MSLIRKSNLYYGGTRKRRVGRPRLSGRRRRGGGFFSSIGNALSKAHDFIKSNKIISTVGNALGSVGVPYAGAIGKAASTLGYGRRRRVVRRRVVRRRRVGGSLRSLLSAAHGFVKKHQLVSKGLTHLGHAKLASAASTLGYGRKRRVGRPRCVGRPRMTRRKRRVGGSLKSILSAAHGFVKKHQLVSKGLSHFGHSKLASSAQALGYGRRRVRPRMIRHRGGANFFSTEQIAAPRF